MISTRHRVFQNTPPQLNTQIKHAIERRLAYYKSHPEQIDQRLGELDQEWDIERVIETEAPTLSLAGLAMGLLRGRKWLIVPLFVQGMMALHAASGIYPLLPLLRRLGFRTEQEIAAERYALKTIRGDFEQTKSPDDVRNAVRA